MWNNIQSVSQSVSIVKKNGSMKKKKRKKYIDGVIKALIWSLHSATFFFTHITVIFRNRTWPFPPYFKIK